GDSIPRPEVELGVGGAILLKWLLPTKKVQVEIESSNIPWPCLKSRFLTVRRNSITTRVFFNVFDLREHLTSELTEE
ncbi:MAG TPA: hypothetical protein VM260_02825, partial [Pirellula sp.]|nr:hypothetical protein [Pirellula sp.]